MKLIFTIVIILLCFCLGKQATTTTKSTTTKSTTTTPLNLNNIMQKLNLLEDKLNSISSCACGIRLFESNTLRICNLTSNTCDIAISLKLNCYNNVGSNGYLALANNDKVNIYDPKIMSLIKKNILDNQDVFY